MIVGLQVGFRYAVGAEILTRMRPAFNGFRYAWHPTDDRAAVRASLEECRDVDATSIQLVTKEVRTPGPLDVGASVDLLRYIQATADEVGARVLLTVGHEAEIDGPNGNGYYYNAPEEYGDHIAEICRGVGVPVYVCGLAALNKRAFNFYARCLPKMAGAVAGIGIHPYKTTKKAGETTPESGCKSERGEYEKLATMALSHGIVLMMADEWGWNTAKSKHALPWERVKFDNHDVATFTVQTLRLHKDLGFAASVVFQYQDAPKTADPRYNPHHEDVYGVIDAHGNVKPVFEAIRDAEGLRA